MFVSLLNYLRRVEPVLQGIMMFSGLLNATLALLARPPAPSEKPTIPSITIGQDVFGRDVAMPLVGAGTWQYNDTIAYESVCKAFSVGYTFVDTALGYKNQKGVGQALQDCWFAKGKTRQDLFVMTKIPGGLSASEALEAHYENLDLLGLDYVDHVMTHFPADWHVTPERSSTSQRQEEWLGLENLYYRGMTRSIGISHYCPQHIEDVMEVATVNPSINQVEYHIGSGDIDHVIDKCKENGIHFMSFSPLCGPCELKDPSDSLINGALVTDIAKNYGVTGSQVALRYIVQQALGEDNYVAGVIPKSNNIEHIKSNAQIFNFDLSEDEMARLKAAYEPAAEDGDCDVP